MLGLNPEELFEQRNVHDSYYSTSSNNYNDPSSLPHINDLLTHSDESEDDEEFNVDVDDIDDIMQDIDFGYRSNSNFPVALGNPLSGYSGSHGFEIGYSVTDDEYDDDGEDNTGEEEDDTGGEEDDTGGEDDDTGGEEDDTGGEEDNTGGEEDDDDDDDEEDNGCVSNNYDTNHSETDSSSDDGREVVITSSPMDSEQSYNSWDSHGVEILNNSNIIRSISSYSEDSTDSSQSSLSCSSSSTSSSSSF